MKPLCILFFLSFLFLICLSPATAMETPSLDECSSITVITSNGWLLRVQKNGEGEMVYGRMIQDTVSFKKGTFSFEELYSSLKKIIKEKGNVLQDVTISFNESNNKIPVEFYSNKTEVIGPFFNKAKSSVTLNTFFKNAWKNNPPPDSDL